MRIWLAKWMHRIAHALHEGDYGPTEYLDTPEEAAKLKERWR